MEKPSLLDKMFGKPFVTDKMVLGQKVEYRVLTNPERVEVWRKHSTSDLLSAPEAIAVPTLARAIVAIDGKTWEQFKEIAEWKKAQPDVSITELVEKHLQDFPFPVINELYIAYAEVVDAFQKNLDELKKNSGTMSPVQSGASAKPSEKTQ